MLRITAIASALAVCAISAGTVQGAEREDLRALRGDVGSDYHAIHQDRASLRQDLQAINADSAALFGAEHQRRTDLRQLRADERAGNIAGIARDRAALSADRATIGADRHKLGADYVKRNTDYAALRHDERRLHHDRRELRHEWHERHEQRVSQNTHSGNGNARNFHRTNVASK